mmetsp:Transcript_32486/g.103581  ORF Transcript_32486/g.103581 Transcript_32486/m.103581 type:complete len:236 (+) Transcript_32486:841-1548(+)
MCRRRPLLRQSRNEKGPLTADPRGPPHSAEAGEEGHEERHGSHGEGRPERSPARFKDFRELRLRLYGSHRRPAAVPRDRVDRNSLRPGTFAKDAGIRGKRVHRRQRLRLRRESRLRRHGLRDGQVRHQGRRPDDAPRGAGRPARDGHLSKARPPRIREGVLSVPPHEQEALRWVTVDVAGKARLPRRQGPRNGPPRQLPPRAAGHRRVPPENHHRPRRRRRDRPREKGHRRSFAE